MFKRLCHSWNIHQEGFLCAMSSIDWTSVTLSQVHFRSWQQGKTISMYMECSSIATSCWTGFLESVIGELDRINVPPCLWRKGSTPARSAWLEQQHGLLWIPLHSLLRLPQLWPCQHPPATAGVRYHHDMLAKSRITMQYSDQKNIYLKKDLLDICHDTWRLHIDLCLDFRLSLSD